MNWSKSSHRNKWLFSKEKVDEKRKQAAAVVQVPTFPRDQQLALQLSERNIIVFSRQLNLSKGVETAALTYFKRWYMDHTVIDSPPLITMLACIYLATKIVEPPIDIGIFLAEVKTLTGAETDMEEVFKGERQLLQYLDFYLITYHPYTTMRVLLEEAPQETAKLIADACDKYLKLSYHTDVALIFAPQVTAVATFMLVCWLYNVSWQTESVNRYVGKPELDDALVMLLKFVPPMDKEIGQAERRINKIRNPPPQTETDQMQTDQPPGASPSKRDAAQQGEPQGEKKKKRRKKEKLGSKATTTFSKAKVNSTIMGFLDPPARTCWKRTCNSIYRSSHHHCHVVGSKSVAHFIKKIAYHTVGPPCHSLCITGFQKQLTCTSSIAHVTRIFGEFSSLSSITITNTEFSDEEQEQMIAGLVSSGCATVALQECTGLKMQKIFDGITRSPTNGITGLSFSGSKLEGSQTVTQLFTLLPNLTNLNLSATGLQDVQIKDLVDALPATKLKVLRIGNMASQVNQTCKFPNVLEKQTAQSLIKLFSEYQIQRPRCVETGNQPPLTLNSLDISGAKFSVQDLQRLLECSCGLNSRNSRFVLKDLALVGAANRDEILQACIGLSKFSNVFVGGASRTPLHTSAVGTLLTHVFPI
eukprot:TRINITY_DN59460_c0_g1_i1.p1 TRINITY_DN59460_c0_g1~~TRINITY_DN59460_c0_g1_i1.p1  ORF type:complete len:644 (-),score=35.32 TRINITY_DN59460_c0_g1_i1:138-2069(-)